MWSWISPVQYDPGKPVYAPRIKSATWQGFRDKITTLHDEGCTKEQIRADVTNDPEAIRLHFKPTMGQLVRMMSTWQLSAHRRRVAVLADQARGATADMPVTGQADASNPKGPFVQIRSPDHDQAPDHVGVDLPRLQQDEYEHEESVGSESDSLPNNQPETTEDNISMFAFEAFVHKRLDECLGTGGLLLTRWQQDEYEHEESVGSERDWLSNYRREMLTDFVNKCLDEPPRTGLWRYTASS